MSTRIKVSVSVENSPLSTISPKNRYFLSKNDGDEKSFSFRILKRSNKWPWRSPITRSGAFNWRTIGSSWKIFWHWSISSFNVSIGITGNLNFVLLFKIDGMRSYGDWSIIFWYTVNIFLAHQFKFSKIIRSEEHTSEFQSDVCSSDLYSF